MKFDPRAFRGRGLQGVTALSMLLTTGTLSWAGPLKNPYTPSENDWSDVRDTPGAQAAQPRGPALERIPSGGMSVEIAPDALDRTGGFTSFSAPAGAAPAAPAAVSPTTVPTAAAAAAPAAAASVPMTQVTGGAAAGVLASETVAPRFSLQLQAGNDRASGTADLFLPFYQDGSSVAFFDLRGIATTQEEFEGNVGIGYRTVVGDVFGEEAVVGAYAFFDLRETENDNQYYQGAFGAEFLTDTFEARINGYLPNSDRNVIAPGPSGVGLFGTTVQQFSIVGLVEQALPGVEAEVGVNLDLAEDLRLSAAAGYFHFERDSTQVAGPKARIELQYSDPFGLDGAIFSIGGEFRNDTVRDTVASGFIRLSIPLSANPTPQRDLSPRARKLGRYVYRDPDIVAPVTFDNGFAAPPRDVVGGPLAANAGPGTPSADGETINVFHVAEADVGTGDCSSAANACTIGTVQADPAYGAGDVVVVVDSAGATISDDFLLTDDLQHVFGADTGGALVLTLPDANASQIVLSDLGGRVAIEGTISPENGTRLERFDLSGAGGPAILIDSDIGVGTVQVVDVPVQGGSHGLSATAAASGAINFDAGSPISGATGTSVQILSPGFEATFNAPVTHAGTGAAVEIANHANGQITFNAPVTSTAGNGVVISNTGPGSQIRFNQDLSLFSPDGTAFSATDIGGSLSVPVAPTVSLQTDTGQALVLNNVTLGGDGFYADTLTATGGGAAAPVSISGTSGGDIVLGDVDIDGTGGAGIDGVVLADVANTLTANSIDIDDVTGNGLEISGTATQITIDSLTVDGAGDAGVFLSGVTGAVSVTSGDLGLASTNQGGLAVDGGAPDLAFGANIANTAPGTYAVNVHNVTGGNADITGDVSGAGDGLIFTGNSGGTVSLVGATSLTGTAGIEVSNNTGGTTAFSGDVDIVTTGVFGVRAAGNTGASLAFSGALDVDTSGGTGTAFSARDGGTIEVTGTTSLVADTGAALDLFDVDIGANGASFNTITANTSGASAIGIENTSGGDIVFLGADLGGVSAANLAAFTIRNAENTVTASNIDIDDVLGDGVAISGTTSLVALDNLTVDNVGGTGLSISGLTGNVSVTGSSIGGTAVNGQSVLIDGLTAGSGVDFNTVSVTANDTAGVQVSANGGDIALNDVAIRQLGQGPALSISANSGTLTADAASDIANANATTGAGVVIQDQSGGLIDIDADVSVTGGGDLIAIGNMTGGTAQFDGDVIGDAGAGISISGVAGGATVALTGATSITGAPADAIVLDGIDGTVGFSDVDIANPGTSGVSITGTVGGEIRFDDLDIVLGTDGTTGVDLSGATITGSVIATDLDITSTSAVDTIGLSIVDATGAGTVRFGDTDASGQSASIAGTAIGVQVSSATNLGAFSFGDGEETTDIGSTIDAAIAINSSDFFLPGQGSYNFLDVDFANPPSANSLTVNLQGIDIFYVDQDGAADPNSPFAAGSVFNPGSVAEAMAASDIDVIALIDTNVDGNADTIDVGAASQGGGTSLVLDDQQILISFNAGGGPIDLTSFGVVADNIQPPFLFSGVATPSLVIDEPDNIDVAPILTTTAAGAAEVVSLTGSGGIANTTITGTGVNGVSASGATDTEVIRLEDLTITAQGGTALEVSDNGQDVSLQMSGVSLTGDTPLSLDGTGGGTLTANEFNDIALDGGVASIVGVTFDATTGGTVQSVSGGTLTATGGVLFDSVTGAVAFDSVDISATGSTALSVTGTPDFTLATSGGTITATDATAIDINGVTTDIALDQISNSRRTTVNIQDATGSFSVGTVTADSGGLLVTSSAPFRFGIQGGSLNNDSFISLRGVTADVVFGSIDDRDAGVDLTDVSGNFSIAAGSIRTLRISGGDADIDIGADIRRGVGAPVVSISERTGGDIILSGSIRGFDTRISVSNNDNGTLSRVTFAGDINLTGFGLDFRNNADAEIVISGNTTITGALPSALSLVDNAGVVRFTGNLDIETSSVGGLGILFLGDVGTFDATGSTTISDVSRTAVFFNPTAAITGDISFADLDIELSEANTTALDFSGVTLDGNFSVDDIDITATGPLTGTTGVDLAGTITNTMGQIRLGDTDVAGEDATIGAGIAIGVNFSDTTAINFVFGDGEGTTDQTSIINATIQINAPTPPTAGTYNFEDVNFTATDPAGVGAPRLPNNVFPAGLDVIFVAATETGDGSGRDVDNRATVVTADAINRQGITFVLINDGNDIVDTDGFTLGLGQDMDGFGNANTIVAGQAIPVNFTGVPGGTSTVTDPTGNGAAVLTSAVTGSGTGTLDLAGNNIVSNIVVENTGSSFLATAIRIGAASGDITLGSASGPLQVQGSGFEKAIEIAELAGALTISDVEASNVNTALFITDVAGSIDVDRLIATSGVGFIGIEIFNLTSVSALTFADEPGDELLLANMNTPVRIAGTGASLITFGAGTTLRDANFTALEIEDAVNVQFDGTIIQSVPGLGGLFTGRTLQVENHTGAVTFGAGSQIDTTNGAGLEFQNADGTYQFLGTTTLNGGDAGIDIFGGSSGTFTFGANSSITSPTGVAFNANASDPIVTYDGTITQTNAQQAVNLTNNTGGSFTFNGLISGTTTTANAVNLTNNSGVAMNFLGGLDLTTTTGTAFNATGGGTITAQDPAGAVEADLTATSGTALNLSGVTIGAAGLEFSDITSTGGTNGIAINGVGGGTFSIASGSSVNVQNASQEGILIHNSAAAFDFAGSATSPVTTTVSGSLVGIGLQNNSGNVTFQQVSVDGSTNAGVIVALGTGTTTIQGGTIGATTTNSTAVSVSGGSGDVTIGAAITNATNSGVAVAFRTGGIVTFSNTITQNGGGSGVFADQNTGGSVIFDEEITVTATGFTGINLMNNTGATFAFNGGLDITTTNGTAFNATGGGTITSRDPAGATEADLTATSGTALNLNGVTIGASGLEFSDITASGGTNGIAIDNVDGGTFSIASGDSVSVTGTTGDGIIIQNSSADFLFTGSASSPVVTTVNQAGDEAVALNNNTGAISFDELNIADPSGRGIEILNAQGDVTIGGGAYQHTNNAGVGFSVTIQDQAASSTITFTDFDISGSALTIGTADLFNVQSSAGTITATGGTWTASNNNDIVDITGGTATISIGAEINQTGQSAVSSNAVEIDGVTGGSITFTGPITQAGAGSAVDADGNSGVVVTFDGLVSATGGSSDTGIDLTTNTGATFAFNGGLDITTSTGTAFNATGGGTITARDPAGVVEADLTATAGTALSLNGVTIGAAGLEFSDIVSTNATGTGIDIRNTSGGTISTSAGGTIDIQDSAETGINIISNEAPIDFSGGAVTITNPGQRGVSVNGTTAPITFGQLTITNPSANPAFTLLEGILLTGTITDQITIADLDVAIGQDGSPAVEVSGTLNADFLVTDFDATVIGTPTSTIGVDITAASGSGTIRLGDTDVAGASASIGAGFETGVDLRNANIAFIFGDGEEATDQGSTILATTAIDASTAPAGGSYNFLDVSFGGSPGAGFGVGDVFFVDSNGATGGGNGSGTSIGNPGTLAAIEAQLSAGDVVILVNDGNTITAENSNGDDTFQLLDGVQVVGFGDGAGGSQDASVTFTNQPLIQLPGNALSFQDPTGNGAAVLTTSTAEPVITLGSQDNRIVGFTLDGFNSAAGGIIDNGGATNTVIDTMDVQNFTGTGIEITPSTGTTINNVDFANNGTDTFVNAANTTITNVTSTGGVNGIFITNATGTTTLTNVSLTNKTGTALSFDNAQGTVNATNVDVDTAGDGALLISGSSAAFTFDATSSLKDGSGPGGALFIQNSSGNVTFNGTITQNVQDVAVTVQSQTVGAINLGGAITVTNGGGLGFFNVDSTVNVTGAVTLNDTGNATGVGIDIQGGSDGTFTFAEVDITNTAAGTVLGTPIALGAAAIGVDIFDSPGATVTFTDLDITSAADIGVAARNGGTLNIGSAAGDPSVINAGIGIYFNDTSGTVTNAQVTGGGVFDPGIQIAGYSAQPFGDNLIGGQDGILILTDQVQTSHTITGTTASGVSGIFVENVGDVDQILAFNRNTLTGTGDAGLAVENLFVNFGATGEIFVTSLDSNTVLAGADGGMDFFFVMFDADPTTTAFETVTGGNTRIGTTAARVALSGLTGDVQGALSFTDLDIAIDGEGTGASDAISILGFNNFTLTAQDGTLDAVNGAGAIFFEGGTLDATFASLISIDAGTDGVEINDTDGSLTITGSTTISGAGDDGIDIFASALDVTVQGNTSIAGIAGGDDAITLTDATGTISFGTVTIGDPDQQGIDVDGDAGRISFGDTTITGVTNSEAVDLSGLTIDNQISFDSLQIDMAGGGQTAVNLSGSTVNATVTAGDFDIGVTGNPVSVTGIDLRDADGTGSITLGDQVVGGEDASISVTGVGVLFSGGTDIDFIFGDGEQVLDRDSSIIAGAPIAGTLPPAGQGTYNFLDVGTITGNLSLLGVPTVIFVDQNQVGANDGSSVALATSVATAESTPADVIVLVDTNPDGTQDIIDIASDTLVLDNGQILLSFASGDGEIDLTTLGFDTPDLGAFSFAASAGINAIVETPSGIDSVRPILEGNATTLINLNGGAGLQGLFVTQTAGSTAIADLSATDGEIFLLDLDVTSTGNAFASVSFAADRKISIDGFTGRGSTGPNAGFGISPLAGTTTVTRFKDLTYENGNVGVLLGILGGGSLVFDAGAQPVSGGTLTVNNVATGSAVSFLGTQGSITFDAVNIDTVNDGLGLSGLGANSVIDFGATSITNATGRGVDYVTSAGTSTVAFQTLNISSGTIGLFALNTGTLDIRDGSGSITASAGPALTIQNTALETNGVSGITFANLTSGGSATAGVSLSGVTDNITVTGATSITGAALGIVLSDTITGDIDFGDVDIVLDDNDAVAFDAGGATIDGAVSADDFDVSVTGTPTGTVGVDLTGTTGTGSITLGDPAMADGASISAGISVGVSVSGTTDIDFVFGDGEGASDTGSTIASTIQINSPVNPVGGTYNFQDVDFGLTPNNIFPAASGDLFFVDSDGNATGGGDGSGSDVNNPATIAAADANTTSGVTFVLVNDGSNIDDADGFTLDPGQNIDGFGNGNTFSVGQDIPVFFTGVPGGGTTITDPFANDGNANTGGAAELISFNATALTVAGNNTVANISIEGEASVADVIDVTGATGTVTFGSSDGPLIVHETNGTPILALFNLSGLAADVTFVNVETGGFTTAVNVDGIAGGSIDVERLVINSATAGLNFSGALGTLALADEATDILQFRGAGGTAIRFNQTAAGTISFGANTSVEYTLNGTALDVNGGIANVTFSGTVTEGPAPSGGGPRVSIRGGHTGTVTFDAGSSLTATTGTGLQFNTADGTYTFNGTTTLNGGDAGIDIVNGSDGTFTFGANTSITDPNGVAFRVNNSAPTSITYDGTITQNNAFSAVSIDGMTSGTASFNGAIIANTGVETGIGLTNSAGGTFNFTGGLDIDTTAGFGLNATGGGTVNVAQPTTGFNNIDAASSTAINLSGVATSTGLAFNRVTSGTVTTGSGGDGISILNLGGTGSFSAGEVTVVNPTDHGIEIVNNTVAMDFGIVSVTNPGTPDAAVRIAGTVGAAITFTDLDIALETDTTTGFSVNSAIVNAAVSATGFDLTSTSATGTIGVDLGGTTGTGTIQLGDTDSAGGDATIAGAETGVRFLGNTAVTFTFGDGEGAADTGSRIDTTIQISSPVNPTAGTYNFQDVDFALDINDVARAVNNVFPASGNLFFVAATATGTGSGADLSNLANVTTADANTTSGVTFVLVNDGSNIDDTNGFTLGLGQNIDGFGNGNTFSVGQDIPAALFFGVPDGSVTLSDADQPASGAATLTSSAATVLALAGDNSVANVIVFGDGQGGIGMSGATGDITLGSSDGALVLNGTGAGSAIDTGGLNGSLEIVDVRATGFNTGLRLGGVASNPNAALDIDTLFLSSTTQNILIFGTTGVLNLADEAGDALTLQGGSFGLRLTSTLSGTVNVGGNTTISGTSSAAVDVFGGSANLNFAGEVTNVGTGSNSRTVAVGGGHDGTLTFETGSSLAATQGTGLQFNNADGTYNFNGTTTLTVTSQGIHIVNGSDGTFDFGANTTLTRVASTSFVVNGGTASVTYSGDIDQRIFNPLLTVTDHATGTITFDTGTLTDTAGPGIDFINADGTYNFNGTVNLTNASSNIDIFTGSTGTFNFGTGVTVRNSLGASLQIFNADATVTFSGNITNSSTVMAVNVRNHAAGTVTFDTGTISATTGTGLQFNNADGVYNFNGTTTLNGGDAGIDILNGSSGTFTFGANTSITDPSGTAFNVNGGAPTVTYNGTITQNNAATAVSIVQTTGGAVTFNGQVTGNTGDQQGVSLIQAASATFAGGLDLTTTTATALSGIIVTELNITGTGNTLTTNANPISLNTVGIGTDPGDGITFDTISGANTLGSGIGFSGITGGTFRVTGTTTVTHSGNTGAAIDFRGASTATFDFADVDITQTNAGATNPTGINILGTPTSITMRDLDITFADGTGSTGILLQADGGGTVTLGEPTMTGGSSITGADQGVLFSATTNIAFTFGDGEDTNDIGSTITATTAIAGTLPPAGQGTYNFLDVSFPSGTGIAGVPIFFAAPGASGGGTSFTDPGSLIAAEAASVQTVVFFDNTPDNTQGVFTLIGSSFDLDNQQVLVSIAAGETIDLSTFGVPAVAGPGANFQFNANTPAPQGTTLTAPAFVAGTGPIDSVDPILRASSTANAIRFSLEGTVVGVFAETTSTIAPPIVILNNGGTRTITLEDVTLTAATTSAFAASGTPPNSTAIVVNNSSFTSTGSQPTFSVTGTAPITIGGSGNTVTNTGTGVALEIDAQNAASSNITIDAAGLSFSTVTASGNATTGSPIDFRNLSGGAVTVETANITQSGFSSAVLLDRNTSAVNINTGATPGTISDSGPVLTAIAAINVVEGDGAVAIGGTIVTSGIKNALLINNRTGGTVTISANVQDPVSNSGGGILIGGNTNTTINFTGSVQVQQDGATAVSFNNNASSQINFDGGLVIALDSGIGLSFSTDVGTVTASDFDLTGTSAAGSRGVVLAGARAGTITLGTPAMADGASITGVDQGIQFSASTNVAFTFGDGEGINDIGSTIDATTALSGSLPPAGQGTYNFLDVLFPSGTGLPSGGPTVFFATDATNGTGDGSSFASPDSLVDAENATADVIVVFDATDNNSQDTIALGSNQFTIDDGQTIVSISEGETIDLTAFGVAAGGAPANFQFNANTPTGGSSTITAPTVGVDTVDPLITSTTGTFFVNNGDATLVNLEIVGTRAILSSANSGTHTIRLDGVTATGTTFAALEASPTGGATQNIVLNNSTLNSQSGSFALQSNGGTLSGTGSTLRNTSTGGALTLLNASVGAGGITFAEITTTGNTSGGGTLVVNGLSGTDTLTVQNLSVQGANRPGALLLSNTAPVNIAGGTIRTTGTGVEIGSGTAGSGGSGDITIGASISTINHTSGRAAKVFQRTGGTVTFSGALIDTSPGNGGGLEIANNSGGTINFTNAQKDIGTSSATAVDISQNTGATINFTGGGLDIATGAGIGFRAVGGGTVTVQGANNRMVVTTSGQAVLIEDTTIGAAGVTFQSISRSSNTFATNTAIEIDNTGTTGVFRSSGGTLRSTGAGDVPTVLIQGNAAVSLANMTIESQTSEAVDVIAPDNTQVIFNFDNNTFRTTGVHAGGVVAVIEIEQPGPFSGTGIGSGTIDGTITNNRIETLSAVANANGIAAEVDGTGNVTLDVRDNRISLAGNGAGFTGTVRANASGSLNVTFINNNTSVAGSTDPLNAGLSMEMFSTAGGSFCIDVANNNFQPTTGSGFHIGEEVFIGAVNGGTGTMQVVQGAGGVATFININDDAIEAALSTANNGADILMDGTFADVSGCTAPAALP